VLDALQVMSSMAQGEHVLSELLAPSRIVPGAPTLTPSQTLVSELSPAKPTSSLMVLPENARTTKSVKVSGLTRKPTFVLTSLFAKVNG
jgi:hypothetical protein